MTNNWVPEVIPEVDQLVAQLADKLANVRETVMLEALENLVREINTRRRGLKRENGVRAEISKKIL